MALVRCRRHLRRVQGGDPTPVRALKPNSSAQNRRDLGFILLAQ